LDVWRLFGRACQRRRSQKLRLGCSTGGTTGAVRRAGGSMPRTPRSDIPSQPVANLQIQGTCSAPELREPRNLGFVHQKQAPRGSRDAAAEQVPHPTPPTQSSGARGFGMAARGVRFFHYTKRANRAATCSNLYADDTVPRLAPLLAFAEIS
jgi:hypothetical protein